MTKIKLFCFPYAGGSSVIFNNWKKYLNAFIELKPIELSGRGKRFNEPLYKNIPEAIEDVFYSIKDEINEGCYALFGHSMGGMISYELAQKIQEYNLPGPVHVFFSGRHAPHVKKENEKIYHILSTEDFKKEVINLGGTPPDFFDYPELSDAFLPLLKNDFKLAEENLNHNKIQALNCDITVFFGKEEDILPEQCDGWKKHTNGFCTIHYFNGGHFFISEETDHIVKIINATLLGYNHLNHKL